MGKQGFFLCCGGTLGVPLKWKRNVGGLLSCLNVIKDPSKAQDGSVDSFLKTPQMKRASSCLEGRISWFFSNCGSKVEVPLELRWGPQDPLSGATGNSNLSCELQRQTSGFLCSCCQALNPHLKLSPEPYGSFPVPTWILEFLLSLHRGVRPRLEWRHAPALPLELKSSTVSCRSDILDWWFSLEVPKAITTAIVF